MKNLTGMKKGKIKSASLDFFDAILMRQDPPFNMDFINNTYILELLQNWESKYLMIQKP